MPTKTQNTIQTVAQELADAFTSDKRHAPSDTAKAILDILPAEQLADILGVSVAHDLRVMATSEEGKTFYKIKDDAPAWTHKEENEQGECLMLRVHRAVDDRFPDDWIYEQAAHAADSLTQYDDLDAMRDAVSEIADGLVDVYNNARSAWLASSLNNAALVDEACGEMGNPGDVFKAIGYGQYRATEAIVSALIDAIEQEAEKRD